MTVTPAGTGSWDINFTATTLAFDSSDGDVASALVDSATYELRKLDLAILQ